MRIQLKQAQEAAQAAQQGALASSQDSAGLQVVLCMPCIPKMGLRAQFQSLRFPESPVPIAVFNHQGCSSCPAIRPLISHTLLLTHKHNHAHITYNTFSFPGATDCIAT